MQKGTPTSAVNKTVERAMEAGSGMHTNVGKTWASALEMLRSILKPDIFNLWFEPIRPVGMAGDVIMLEVANDFCEVWLKDNYLGLLQDAITHAAGQPDRKSVV